MALIKKREKIEKKNVGVRIEKHLAEKLERYSAYTNVPTAEIVGTAIEHVINSDGEFLKTLGHEKVSRRLVPSKTAAA